MNDTKTQTIEITAAPGKLNSKMGFILFTFDWLAGFITTLTILDVFIFLTSAIIQSYILFSLASFIAGMLISSVILFCIGHQNTKDLNVAAIPTLKREND